MSFASILRNLIGLAATAIVTLAIIYVSRFWIWTAPWGNDGLLGMKFLTPYGDLVRRWLGGTWLREFDLLIWFCGTVLVLSFLQWLVRRLAR